MLRKKGLKGQVILERNFRDTANFIRDTKDISLVQIYVAVWQT